MRFGIGPLIENVLPRLNSVPGQEIDGSWREFALDWLKIAPGLVLQGFESEEAFQNARDFYDRAGKEFVRFTTSELHGQISGSDLVLTGQALGIDVREFSGVTSVCGLIRRILTDCARGGERANCLSVDRDMTTRFQFCGHTTRFPVTWDDLGAVNYREQCQQAYAMLCDQSDDVQANKWLGWHRIKRGMDYEEARERFVPLSHRRLARDIDPETDFNDDFQTGHNVGDNLDVNANWGKMTGSPGNAFIRDEAGDLGPRSLGSTEGIGLYLHVGNFSSDDHEATGSNLILAGNPDFGVIARSNGTTAYRCKGANTSFENRIQETSNSGASWSNVGGAMPDQTWVNGDSIKIDVSGTTIGFYKGGVLVDSRTDSTITVGKQAGLFTIGTGGATGSFFGAYTSTDNIGGMTINAQQTGNLHPIQQVSGSCQLRISGTYSGSPTSIEYQITVHGVATQPGNWIVGDASPTGGSYDFTVAVTADADRKQIHVRQMIAAVEDARVTDPNAFLTGDIINVLGQSNGQRPFYFYPVTASTNDVLVQYVVDPTEGLDSWRVVQYSGGKEAAELYYAKLQTKWAVAVLVGAEGGTSVDDWTQNPTSAPYDRNRAVLTLLADNIRGAFWCEGEKLALADDARSEAQYQADLHNVLDTQLRGDLGLPSLEIGIIPLGRNTDIAGPGAQPAIWQKFAHAQLNFPHLNTFICSSPFSNTHTDNVHRDAAGYIAQMRAAVLRLSFILGEQATNTGLGPAVNRLQFVTGSGNLKTNFAFTLANGATTITSGPYEIGPGGAEVTAGDDTALASSGTENVNGNSFNLIHVATAQQGRMSWGAGNDSFNPAQYPRDNNPDVPGGLPVEPFTGQAILAEQPAGGGGSIFRTPILEGVV